ncbi:MAG TPA: ectonucleotide pyrophosphatase/phosphodiesterase [Melioribacteraceae bacterium]|mgnify:CR=1 FL=1|nr:ectonucleotide pyrophosphatase/phosphodiesterase [Melioribacteraceae bacterium]
MKKALKTVFTLILLFLISNSTAASEKPYVILISFDGFRWDYLYRGLSPNLEMIRNNGVSALSLRPAFPSKTFPNHQSIITGMYIENHGIIANTFRDPFNNTIYRMGDTNAVRDSRWYLGEAFWETAERNGITTASYFWPGSEMTLEHRRPTYYHHYEHARPYEKRVDGVVEWLKLPVNDRPYFITLYFDDTDTQGHRHGTDSDEVNNAIKRLDGMIGLLFDKLTDINMRDSVNIIIVSDHGMTDISKERTINIEKILEGMNCKFFDNGPFMTVDVTKDNIEEVYQLLKKNENRYKVYKKKEMPEYFHYKNHPFIGELLLIADMGWAVITNRQSDYSSLGNHGYDNNHTDMHGIFLAIGPDFKSGYRTGTIWNIDIYPLLCRIFNIAPRSNIDGKAERIEFILK